MGVLYFTPFVQTLTCLEIVQVPQFYVMFPFHSFIEKIILTSAGLSTTSMKSSSIRTMWTTIWIKRFTYVIYALIIKVPIDIYFLSATDTSEKRPSLLTVILIAEEPMLGIQTTIPISLLWRRSDCLSRQSFHFYRWKILLYIVLWFILKTFFGRPWVIRW